MKNFFIKLDKNLMNLILVFITSVIQAWVLKKYNISFFDMCISYICIVTYLRVFDLIIASFKEGD